MASTFAHLTGFLYGVRLPVQVGGATAVYQDVWDPAEFVDLVEEHRITYTSAATPFLHDTLPRRVRRPATSPRCGSSAAWARRSRGPSSARPAAALPGLTVLGGWGQSENALVTLGIPGDPEEKLVERDGYPWPGMEIRVVDFAGRRCPPGQEGAAAGARPFLFAGYAAPPGADRGARSTATGSTPATSPSIDADGYLNITGRTKDVIIRGGENIPVAYVENVLYEHPDVAAVAVVGLPDPRLQERACAVVVLKTGRAGVHDGRHARVPRREGRGPAVLARAAGAVPGAAPHRQRQDPQVRAEGHAAMSEPASESCHSARASPTERSGER